MKTPTPKLSTAEKITAEKARFAAAIARFNAALSASTPTDPAELHALTLERDSACRALACWDGSHPESVPYASRYLTANDGANIAQATFWLAQHEAAVTAARVYRALRVDLPRKLTESIATHQATLEQFSADVLKDGLYALEWADKAYAAAAKRQVAGRVLAILTAEKAVAMPDAELVKHLISYVRGETLRRARSASRSTSGSSNLIEDAQRVAYADLDEALVSLPEGFLGWSL